MSWPWFCAALKEELFWAQLGTNSHARARQLSAALPGLHGPFDADARPHPGRAPCVQGLKPFVQVGTREVLQKFDEGPRVPQR